MDKKFHFRNKSVRDLLSAMIRGAGGVEPSNISFLAFLTSIKSNGGMEEQGRIIDGIFFGKEFPVLGSIFRGGAWKLYRNCKVESSVICQYVCQ